MGRLSTSKTAPLWLALALMGAVYGAHAAPVEALAAAVDGVVMPAWLERGGRREPIFPGMVLQERDRVVPWSKARIPVTFPEGKKVKTGENGQQGF